MDSKKHNIPVFWNIEEFSEDVYTLEVSIGRYNIKEGDTLSEIAQQFNTTIEKLMMQNKNIKDPDVIYAGDYLVIFSVFE